MAELSLLTKLSLFAVGLMVGGISPTFGIGGGLVTVPILILLYGLDGNLWESWLLPFSLVSQAR